MKSIIILFLLIFLIPIEVVFADIEDLEIKMDNLKNEMIELKINQNNLQNEINPKINEIENKITSVSFQIKNQNTSLVEINKNLQDIEKMIGEVKVYGDNKKEPVYVDILEQFIPQTALDWILIISSIASIGLVIIVGKQTANARYESNIKFRAWITIEDVNLDKRGFVTKDTGKVVSWLDYVDENDDFNEEKIRSIQVDSSAFNVGFIPASKVEVRHLISETEITIEKIRKDGIETTVGFLMPNEKFDWNYEFSPSLYINSGKNPFYMGAECQYTTNEKSYIVGKIWKEKATVTTVIKTWFEEIK